MVAKTPFVPFQLAATQLLGEAEGYFALHLAVRVQASTIFTLLVGILCTTTSSLALALNKLGLLPRFVE